MVGITNKQLYFFLLSAFYFEKLSSYTGWHFSREEGELRPNETVWIHRTLWNQ